MNERLFWYNKEQGQICSDEPLFLWDFFFVHSLHLTDLSWKILTLTPLLCDLR